MQVSWACLLYTSNLGLSDPIAVSGAHGIGIGDILDAIVNSFPDKIQKDYDGMTRFCVIGRPNVGKSSLVNALLNQERVIVSNIEGTTRDAIDTPFKREGKMCIRDSNIIFLMKKGLRNCLDMIRMS